MGKADPEQTLCELPTPYPSPSEFVYPIRNCHFVLSEEAQSLASVTPSPSPSVTHEDVYVAFPSLQSTVVIVARIFLRTVGAVGVAVEHTD